MRKNVIVTLSVLIVMSVAWALLVYSKKGRAQPSAFLLGTNAGSYLVGEYVTYKIFGAPPNSPIYWTSFLYGQPTLEVDSYYGQMTDDQGNWEGEVGPWTTAHYGNWLKQAKVGGIVSTTGFSVIEGDTWSCPGPVSECLRIAKEKGSTRVWLAPRLSDGYGSTTDFNAVKDRLLVVHAKQLVSIHFQYDTQLDRLVTYEKWKVDILREPPHPCTQCTSPPTLPPGLSAGPDEMLVRYDGGNMTIDGVNLFTDMTYIAAAPEQVFLLNRNEHYPKLASLATGRNSAFPIIYSTSGEKYVTRIHRDSMGPNEDERWHPLISLNIIPNDPASDLDIKLSDFINLLNN